uniref:Uncharacterized protein n=1 Tax=Arundo donax TaxID=35708 RepID=A0A0A9FXV0_ARUDO
MRWSMSSRSWSSG